MPIRCLGQASGHGSQASVSRGADCPPTPYVVVAVILVTGADALPKLVAKRQPLLLHEHRKPLHGPVVRIEEDHGDGA